MKVQRSVFREVRPDYIAGELRAQWESICNGMIVSRFAPDSEVATWTRIWTEQTFKAAIRGILGGRISEEATVDRCEFLRAVGMTCGNQYPGDHPDHDHRLAWTADYAEFFKDHEVKRAADQHRLSEDDLNLVGGVRVDVRPEGEHGARLTVERADGERVETFVTAGARVHIGGHEWKVENVSTEPQPGHRFADVYVWIRKAV